LFEFLRNGRYGPHRALPGRRFKMLDALTEV
jgi:hypothetical protein